MKNNGYMYINVITLVTQHESLALLSGGHTSRRYM
jgi:hypothetical protein